MKEKFLGRYQIIGKKVKALRTNRNWTQNNLATRCSVNEAEISRIENAKRDYMFSTLLEVCEALEVSIDELMKE